MVDPQRFAKTVEICTGVISMGMVLAGKKSFFGALKPTRDQIGWCIGFCDAAAQEVGADDTETTALATIFFEDVYGRAGPKYVRQFLNDQGGFPAIIMAGGTAFVEWGKSGRSPLPPMSY